MALPAPFNDGKNFIVFTLAVLAALFILGQIDYTRGIGGIGKGALPTGG